MPPECASKRQEMSIEQTGSPLPDLRVAENASRASSTALPLAVRAKDVSQIGLPIDRLEPFVG